MHFHVMLAMAAFPIQLHYLHLLPSLRLKAENLRLFPIGTLITGKIDAKHLNCFIHLSKINNEK